MRKYYGIVALLGALAIVLGAFGAHALKEILSEKALNSFETGVRYQIYHVLFLLMILNLSDKLITNQRKTIIANLTLIGMVLFSGSIYMLALQILPVSYIWFVTPLGGLFLIIAWLLFAVEMFKKK